MSETKGTWKNFYIVMRTDDGEERLTGLIEDNSLLTVNARLTKKIEALNNNNKLQAEAISQLTKENKILKERIKQLNSDYNELNLEAVKVLDEKRELEKTLKSRNKYIDELETNCSFFNYYDLKTKLERSQEMYNELMEKNIKLQKIIDALTEE